MEKKKILVVEDEKAIADILEFNLGREGYDTMAAYDGAEGLHKALTESPDLILLDVMLPEMDGFEVCRRVRAQSDIPIIMLTAREEEADKVMGLELGADDYITKPFAIEELLARIRAALRKRTAAPEEALLTAGPLTMNVDKHQVTMKDQPVELTKKEFDLLRHLLENKGHVLSRETLLDSVWGVDFVGETNSVDVYIRFLRSKLDEAFGFKLIHTVRGVGYVIREN